MREKIVSNLQYLIEHTDDEYALDKLQEVIEHFSPIHPICSTRVWDNGKFYMSSRCPRCDAVINNVTHHHYCGNCGHYLVWDGMDTDE